MVLVSGDQVKTEGKATSLALREAGAEGMAHDVPALFKWATNHDELWNAIQTVVGRAVHAEYGKRSRWWLQRLWYVPVPHLSYTREGVAHLRVNVNTHLVAPVRIEVGDYVRSATAVGPVGKVKTAVLPISLLLALLGDDLTRFHIVAKDGPWTTFEVPGMRAVTLHDGFLDGLARALARAPVDRLLRRFGIESEGVVPLVVEDLLALVTGGRVRRPHLNVEAIEESIVTRMGYSQQKARELIARADLRAYDSEEGALRKVLAQADARS